MKITTTKTTTVEASWPVPPRGITPSFLRRIEEEIRSVPGLWLRCTIHYEPPVAVSSSDRALIEPARFWIKETFEEEDDE